MEPSASPPREYLGAPVRITLDLIAKRGLTQKIRAMASPEVARVLDKPPWPLAWVDARVLDELETLLLKLAGSDACIELGLLAGRNLGGGMIAPVLKMAMGLFGRSPATVFGNLDRFYSMVMRGVSFSYEPTSATSGVVEARVQGPGVPAAMFDVTRGNLSYVFEVCGVSGTVDPPRVLRHDENGAQIRLTVRWS